jgi:hypothetical protein
MTDKKGFGVPVGVRLVVHDTHQSTFVGLERK